MILSKRSFLFPWSLDQGISALLCVLAGFTGALLLLLTVFLVMEAWPVLTQGGWRAFIANSGWHPLEGQFGVLPMVWASLAVMLGAVLLAAPLGIASAVFVRFYAANSLSYGYRLILNLLAGIPSVVYGLWGLTELVPMIARLQPPGTSLLAAILVLAVMILPTIALTSAAALEAVPHNILAGAAALGISRKGQIVSVALPAAYGGILGGVLLAMARAVGETMAVLMVAGNVVQSPHSLFAPIRALTANIALEMAYAMDMHRAGLFASGLLLTLLVFFLSWMAARTIQKYHYG